MKDKGIRVNSKFQIYIPKEFREYSNIEPGDRFVFSIMGHLLYCKGTDKSKIKEIKVVTMDQL